MPWATHLGRVGTYTSWPILTVRRLLWHMGSFIDFLWSIHRRQKMLAGVWVMEPIRGNVRNFLYFYNSVFHGKRCVCICYRSSIVLKSEFWNRHTCTHTEWRGRRGHEGRGGERWEGEKQFSHPCLVPFDFCGINMSVMTHGVFQLDIIEPIVLKTGEDKGGSRESQGNGGKIRSIKQLISALEKWRIYKTICNRIISSQNKKKYPAGWIGSQDILQPLVECWKSALQTHSRQRVWSLIVTVPKAEAKPADFEMHTEAVDKEKFNVQSSLKFSDSAASQASSYLQGIMGRPNLLQVLCK